MACSTSGWRGSTLSNASNTASASPWRFIAGQPAAIGLDYPQRGRIVLVGALETFARFGLVAGELGDHAGMQILEDGIPVRPGELVDRGDRALAVALSRASVQPDSSVAVRSVIGPRIDCARSLRAAAYFACLIALTPSTRRATRSDLSACATGSASFTDPRYCRSASSDMKTRSRNSPFFGSTRERRPVIGSSGDGVALLAGMARGEITAGRRNRKVRARSGPRRPRGLCRGRAGTAAIRRYRTQCRRRCTGTGSKRVTGDAPCGRRCAVARTAKV